MPHRDISLHVSCLVIAARCINSPSVRIVSHTGFEPGPLTAHNSGWLATPLKVIGLGYARKSGKFNVTPKHQRWLYESQSCETQAEAHFVGDISHLTEMPVTLEPGHQDAMEQPRFKMIGGSMNVSAKAKPLLLAFPESLCTGFMVRSMNSSKGSVLPWQVISLWVGSITGTDFLLCVHRYSDGKWRCIRAASKTQ